jgi:AcrR family transcriptional regulator
LSVQPRGRTRLRPEIRREQIVDAAVGVFDGRDPTEVTFEQVAEAAGVSRGLVYNYFGDKQGLIAAVYLRTLQHLDASLAAGLRGDEAPEELLRCVVTGYLRFAQAHSRGFGYLVGNAAATLHPEVRAARLERIRRVAERWGGPDPDALLVGHAVVGLLETVTVEWLTSGDGDVEHAASVVADLLWSGLSGLEQLRLAPATVN